MDAGVGVAPTGIMAYETRWRPRSTRKNWWRLAVSLRALVVFSHAPSLDRLNLQVPDFTLRRIFLPIWDFYPPCLRSVTLHSVEKIGIRGEDRTRPLGFGDQTDH
jgi:hypothetical protein